LSTLTRLRRVIAKVPRGKVITYGQVAEAAGFPGAARLTVWALQGGDELPWHRVVAAGGRIALPGSEGREQRLRLQLEGVTFRGGRVRMDLHEWRAPRPRKVSRPRRVRRPTRPAKASPRPASGSSPEGTPGFGPRPEPIPHDRLSDLESPSDDR